MIFNLNGFTIDVDVDRTKKFYDKLTEEHYYCPCDNCRNYMLAIEDFPKGVLEFFKKLGIDIRKPPEVYKLFGDPKNNCVYYQGFYDICGLLIRDKRKKITHDFNDDGFTVLTDDNSYSIADNYLVHFNKDVYFSKDDLPPPAFHMEIDFSKVPWKLSDPLSI